MGEFEDKVKAAFDAEIQRVPGRPGLRQRVIAKAVATPRRRPSWLSVWMTPPRMALVGAAAAVLIVAGIGIRLATVPTPSAVQTQLAFGKVPGPSLHPAFGLGGGGGPSVIPYFGPAKMSWSGQLPAVPSSAPIYRFNLPTSADADALAARLQGTLTSAGAPKEPRMYQLPGGWTLSVSLNDPVAGEPTFSIYRTTPPSGGPPVGEAAARAAADAELASLGLTPAWKYEVSVTTTPGLINQGPTYGVQYQRVIGLSHGVTAREVDGAGEPAGIRVVVDSSGKVQQVSGIFRLTEKQASYPLRTPSSTISEAVNAPPAQQQGQSGPTPSVTLTSVRLVYTVVSSHGVGYLEPAYLFTGTFIAKGTTLEKRVLVSALATSALAR